MGLLNYFFTLEGRRKIFSFIVRNVRWLSVVLFLGGITWLLLLLHDDFNLPCRIEENALLPGQVQTHFGGSDYKVLNAYRNEIRLWQEMQDNDRLDSIESIFTNAGMKSARQSYNVTLGTRAHVGTNIYGLLEAPRGDATEALVLNAAWQDKHGVVNEGGVAQLLALARYFRRWSLWSKDILFVIPADRDFGSQAWIDAYHENQDVRHIEPLTLTSGIIQAGVDIHWYGEDNRYDEINVRYEGSNGQLANLDLVNSAIHIAKHQLGIMPYVQRVHGDDFVSRLLVMFRALSNQAHGFPTGSHSPYIPYKIDTISIEVEGKSDGYHDDSSLGRIFESVFRSLNNILEHLHASVFFYILISTHRFVSIGTYLPSAMLIAICFTITGLSLYLKATSRGATVESAKPVENPKHTDDDFAAAITKTELEMRAKIEPRPFAPSRTLRPAAVVAAAHISGLLLFYILRLAAKSHIPHALSAFLLLEYCTSLIGPSILSRNLTLEDGALINSFSQIMLGMFLSAIASVNFPLSLFIGIIAFPTAFVSPTNHKIAGILLRVALLVFTSPISVFSVFCALTGTDWRGMVIDFVFGYEWQHVWTPLAIFGVWWPAYFLANVVLSG